VIAAALTQAGLKVQVVGVDPASPDAVSAKRLAGNNLGGAIENPRLVIDALLGTGASGPIRPVLEPLIARLRDGRERGATIVSLDLPTGLDASSGWADERTVPAHLTLSFGTFKRGQLIRRDLCGELVAVDIGLGEHSLLVDGAAESFEAADVRQAVPGIAANAHKGSRKKVLIVGGAKGMAGAVAYAARAAFASGVGMVRCAVAGESLQAIQTLCPQATAVAWHEMEDRDLEWCDAMILGPGFGSADSYSKATKVLERWRGPVVVDADALTAFAGQGEHLRGILHGRPAILTPHAAEAARLLSTPVAEVLSEPFAVADRLAEATGAVVLLKGAPTVVAQAGRPSLVSARGTPVLATGGSGDLLAGICGTLLAQVADAQEAAASAAWIHGRAAELEQGTGPVRGVVLDDVLHKLKEAWRLEVETLSEWELATLPAVGSG
jgi:NAD(P)H-hydrate epimerase